MGPGGAHGSPSSSPPGSELERGQQSATCSPACKEPGRSAGERRAKLHQDLRPLPRAGIPASGPQASDAQRSTGPLGPRGWGPRANHLPLRPRRHLCRRLPPLGLLFKCSRSCSLFSRRPQALTADGAAASAEPGAGGCVRFCRVLLRAGAQVLPPGSSWKPGPVQPTSQTTPPYDPRMPRAVVMATLGLCAKGLSQDLPGTAPRFFTAEVIKGSERAAPCGHQPFAPRPSRPEQCGHC